MTTAAHHTTSPPKGETSASAQRSVRADFLVAALNMSWQLAIVVLAPIIGGVQLDKALKTKTAFTLVGVGLAFVLSGVVMWRAMQAANKIPVAKLTAAQKHAIQKSYEEDDEDA